MKDASKIIIAAVAGATAGAMLGILFAPASGNDTRGSIAKGSKKMLKSVKDGLSRERLSKAKEKLENQLLQVNAKMDEFPEEYPDKI
jgi:gas vesicle protein